MPISELRDVARMADRATAGTRTVNIEIFGGGITVRGCDFVLREGMPHPITLKKSTEISWTELDIGGTAEIERRITDIIACLDRAMAKA